MATTTKGKPAAMKKATAPKSNADMWPQWNGRVKDADNLIRSFTAAVRKMKNFEPGIYAIRIERIMIPAKKPAAKKIAPMH